MLLLHRLDVEGLLLMWHIAVAGLVVVGLHTEWQTAVAGLVVVGLLLLMQ